MLISLLVAIRNRLLPALITALGVALITAGLLSYADPATAGTAAVETPVVGTAAPSNGPSATLELPPPSAAASGDPSASPTGRAVATRIVIPLLGIDLPVVAGPDGYPYCNVAMYLKELGQPGEGRATYIYAHARTGMFGPVYERAIVQNRPDKLLNLLVQVYTSDDKLYLYETKDIWRGVLPAHGMDAATAATTEQLWLQTSEGPKGTPGKTQLRAFLLSVGQADPTDAHPKAKPIACG